MFQLLQSGFEFITQFSFITLLLAFTVCIVLRYYSSAPRYNPSLPPTVRFWLPIIGHFHLIGKDVRKQFSRFRKQYGNLYSLYLGERLVIVFSGYDVIKESFLKNAEDFSARPKFYLTELISQNRGLVFTNGPIVKEHRIFTISTLREFGMGKSKLVGKIHDEVSKLASEIRAKNREPFDPKDLISTHVANIICSMSFGAKFRHDDERFLEMIRMFDEIFESVAGIANFIPWLAEFPGDPLNCKRALRNSDKVMEYCNNILEEHLREYDENDINDVTNAYIKEMRRLESIGQPTTMNLEQLAYMIADLFIAGSHTTATAIRWAIVCLVQYPDTQDRLFRSISDSIGIERYPSIEDKSSLGFLEAFYMELLRFCNLNVLTGIHATTRDLTFRGFTIPKDAILMPDFDSVFTDPAIWGDPENFRPERFLDENGCYRKHEEMIAFFIGKRNCIGESLARMELFMFIGALVQNFRFESAKGDNLTMDKVDGVFGAVHSPYRYKVVAVPR